MAKNTDIQRQLDALRGEMCTLRDRQDELNDIAKARGIQRFEDANGCKRCRGRGWVVTWDTMDILDGSAAALLTPWRVPKAGDTALSLARKAGHTRIAQLLDSQREIGERLIEPLSWPLSLWPF